MNKDKNGLFDAECGGATGVPGSFDESLCLAPEEACKSQRTLVSFFVRGETGLALSGDIDELSGSSGLLEIGLHIGEVAVDEFSSHGFFARG